MCVPFLSVENSEVQFQERYIIYRERGYMRVAQDNLVPALRAMREQRRPPAAGPCCGTPPVDNQSERVKLRSDAPLRSR